MNRKVGGHVGGQVGLSFVIYEELLVDLVVEC
jgi:hypothetical protein